MWLLMFVAWLAVLWYATVNAHDLPLGVNVTFAIILVFSLAFIGGVAYAV